MCEFMRQPICSLELKAKRLITVYGLRLDCVLWGERVNNTSLLWGPLQRKWHFSPPENLLLCDKASFNATQSNTHEWP